MSITGATTLNTSAARSGNEPALGSESDRLSHELQYETRLAVVMYGGVSLAIYINGVAQELLHLVRATAGDSRNPDPLSPVESVYREVGCRLGTLNPLGAEVGRTIRMRIVVDVLSGTSAGGLNGIFLAKALANGGTMDSLKKLWIKEGDLDLLLNDGNSARESLAWLKAATRKPESLLNSRRMGTKLLEALRDMRPREGGEPAEPKFADELDLFVTATDLAGVATPIRLANGLVYEKRHKAVFHFLGATDSATGGSVNHFISKNDPFLAFAGRCTSSFPLAFEPMQLQEMFEVRDRKVGTTPDDVSLETWEGFYRDFVKQDRDPEVPDSLIVRAASRRMFLERCFGDGGYLDNKPFSHAIGALRWRQAGPQVSRKLVYVEPSPEHPEQGAPAQHKPDAFANLKAAGVDLPRNETIREDLERVLDRNRKIEHARRSLRFMPEDVAAARKAAAKEIKPVPGDDFAKMGLQQLIERSGTAYGAYHRLKVAELTTELAEVVTRVSGLDDQSDDLQAVRTILSAWRQEYYDSERDQDPKTKESRRGRELPEEWKSENQLLMDFDLSYRLRRAYFVMEVAYSLLDLDRNPPGQRGRDSQTSPRFSMDRPAELLDPAIPGIEHFGGVQVCREHLPEFRGAVAAGLESLKRAYRELRVVGRKLRSRGGGSPLARHLVGLELTREECHSVLFPRRANQKVRRARQLLGLIPSEPETPAGIVTGRENRRKLLNDAADAARKDLVAAFICASDLIEQSIPPAFKLEGNPPVDGAGTAAWLAQRCLRFYYDKFETFDMSLFPMIYGTEVGELAEVDIVRISPEDAPGLVEERKPKETSARIQKLAGRRLNNFGAFLHPVWRHSDMLWGRLDAAEILLDQLMPRSGNAGEERTRLGIIRRAQAAILREELVPLGPCDGRRVLVEAFLHTGRKEADSGALTEFLDRIEPYGQDHPDLAPILEREAVQKALQNAFERHRTLPAEDAYQLGARAAAIFGRILEHLQEPRDGATKKIGQFIALAAGAVWGFVEMAIPEGIGRLFIRKWITMLYSLEILLILGGCAPQLGRVGDLGWALLLATAALHAVHSGLRVQFSGSNRVWKRIRIAAAWIAIALGGLGIFKLLEIKTATVEWTQRAWTKGTPPDSTQGTPLPPARTGP